MTAVPVTVSQLLEDPELCLRLIGAKFTVKLNTSVGTLTGYLLRLDPAQGKTLTLLVGDKSPGQEHVLFVFTECIVSMSYDNESRLSVEELMPFRQNIQSITA